MGFCATAGTIQEGGFCSSNNQCAEGFCTAGGFCRLMCQRRDDCGGNEECGPAFYENPLGRWMTTACMPIDGRAEISQSCLVNTALADSGICASGTCDMLPWGYL